MRRNRSSDVSGRRAAVRAMVLLSSLVVAGGLPTTMAGGQSTLEPDWLVRLGSPGSDEVALSLAMLSDGSLLAGGVNATGLSSAGFRLGLDPLDGREISRQADLNRTVSLSADSRGFTAGESRGGLGFVLASYRGNDSRTEEWWNIPQSENSRIDRVAALEGGWVAAAGFVNESGTVQVHDFVGHLEYVALPSVLDSGFRSIAVAHDGSGGLVVAGTARSNSSADPRNIVVERWDREGERTWGGEWDSGRQSAVVTSLASLADGSSYLAGWATKGGLARPHVPFAAWVTPDGQMSWNQLLAIDPTATDAEVRDACVAPDGNVAVVGADLAGPTSGLKDSRVRVNLLTISRGQAGKSVDIAMDVRWERAPGVEAEACVFGADGGLYLAGTIYGPTGDTDAFVGRFDLKKLQTQIADSELMQLSIFAAVGIVVAIVIIVLALRRPRRARKVRIEPMARPTAKGEVAASAASDKP